MKTSFQVFAGLAVISFSLLVRSGFSKEISRIPHQKKSLETLLNQDGTLDMVRGFNGSLDPTGWKMVTDRDGRPRFVRSNVQMKSKLPSEVMAEGDENWDSQFTLSGLDGNVNTIVISESNMYVGGEFTVAGCVSVNHIAKWDGSNWSALGSGVYGTIKAIAVSGTDVYVGGDFTQAGGLSASRIAKWNGSSWSALDSGVNGTVEAIAISGTDVYIGGDFTQAGGLSASRIAKWDGSSWSVLDGGVNGTVEAIAGSGTDVYVGGNFTEAGGLSASRIAKWDGSNWSTLGSGVNDDVEAIEISSSDVYVGGWFTEAGGVGANHIAKWDGSNWSALGGGVNGTVEAIAVSGSDVYVGCAYYSGIITPAGFLMVAYVFKWNGSSWSQLGSMTNGTYGDPRVNAIAIVENNLYIGGIFSPGPVTVGEVFYEQYYPDVNANSIAKWDGVTWSELGVDNAPNGPVLAIAISSNEIYVGGEFSTAGGVPANHIAKWDGSSWSALGSGVNDDVEAIEISGSDVYVGGWFTEAGGVGANRIAKWDGDSWSQLGSGIGPGFVFTIATCMSDLYVGGSFNEAGGTSANNIVKWDGSSWSALGRGVNGIVHTSVVSGNHLYVGGSFTIAADISTNNIARWDGSSWSALGGGVNGTVEAIAVSGSDVYVGCAYYSGIITPAGFLMVAYVFKWNGSSWSQLGSMTNGTYGDPRVNAIAIVENNLYIGGIFSPGPVTVGEVFYEQYYPDVNANSIAKWDGSTWSSVGSGVNGTVKAIVANETDLYVGGNFIQAGGKPSYHFGRWTMPALNAPPVAVGDSVTIEKDSIVTIFVLANDSDPDNDPIRIQSIDKTGTTGTVVINSGDTTVTYIPATGFTGSDTFVYVVSDGNGGLDSAMVFVEVTSKEGIEDKEHIPIKFHLSQNYPNPFNPATTIVYSLAKTSRVRLTIYSIKGDEIITLVDKRQPHGEYWIDWNGKDSLGRPVASEIYFYRLSTESYVKTRKMLFVR